MWNESTLGSVPYSPPCILLVKHICMSLSSPFCDMLASIKAQHRMSQMCLTTWARFTTLPLLDARPLFFSTLLKLNKPFRKKCINLQLLLGWLDQLDDLDDSTQTRVWNVSIFSLKLEGITLIYCLKTLLYKDLETANVIKLGYGSKLDLNWPYDKLGTKREFLIIT